MKEYIERERLKEAFNADLQTLQTLDEHTMDLILIEIDEAPAADVAEVRHGKFNFLQEDMVWCYCGVCSVCRNYVQAWNYCPNCGARMDKEDEHEAG